MRNAAIATAATVLTVIALGDDARAQSSFAEEYIADEERIESPERFIWELVRVGTYTPDAVDNSEALGGDKGPLVATEFDVMIYRIPYVGPIAAGAQLGWARYDGKALDAGGNPTDEGTKLVMYPITPMAVLRVDVLAREFEVPLVLTGKIGLDLVPWFSETGGKRDGSGLSVGLKWGAQAALVLDPLEPRSARRLDEIWGINQSYLFFELFGSTAGGSLPLGAPLAWSVGLGFTF